MKAVSPFVTVRLKLILSVPSLAAPVDHCHLIGKLQSFGGGFQYIGSSLLFLFRVRAVFIGHRYVVWFFYFLWTAVVATCIAAGFALDDAPLGGTKYCFDLHMAKFGAAAMVVSAVNDTLVFVFITGKILRDNRSPYTSVWRTFLTGEGMGKMSRLLLQSGQLYYM